MSEYKVRLAVTFTVEARFEDDADDVVSDIMQAIADATPTDGSVEMDSMDEIIEEPPDDYKYHKERDALMYDGWSD